MVQGSTSQPLESTIFIKGRAQRPDQRYLRSTAQKGIRRHPRIQQLGEWTKLYARDFWSPIKKILWSRRRRPCEPISMAWPLQQGRHDWVRYAAEGRDQSVDWQCLHEPICRSWRGWSATRMWSRVYYVLAAKVLYSWRRSVRVTTSKGSAKDYNRRRRFTSVAGLGKEYARQDTCIIDILFRAVGYQGYASWHTRISKKKSRSTR